MFYNRFQEKKTFYVFNEFIDQFPANFRLRKDFTYFSQLFRRSLSELDSTGLVHPQHWAATFLLQKSYLVANAQWKTLRKSICLLQNSPRYCYWQSHRDLCSVQQQVTKLLGCCTALSSAELSPPTKAACRAPSTGTETPSSPVGPVMLGLVYVLNNPAAS